ncbi:MAG: hypothetical protein ACYC1C_05130 [Chloroflexota bacterium]
MMVTNSPVTCGEAKFGIAVNRPYRDCVTGDLRLNDECVYTQADRIRLHKVAADMTMLLAFAKIRDARDVVSFVQQYGFITTDWHEAVTKRVEYDAALKILRETLSQLPPDGPGDDNPVADEALLGALEQNLRKSLRNEMKNLLEDVMRKIIGGLLQMLSGAPDCEGPVDATCPSDPELAQHLLVSEPVDLYLYHANELRRALRLHALIRRTAREGLLLGDLRRELKAILDDGPVGQEFTESRHQGEQTARTLLADPTPDAIQDAVYTYNNDGLINVAIEERNSIINRGLLCYNVVGIIASEFDRNTLMHRAYEVGRSRTLLGCLYHEAKLSVADNMLIRQCKDTRCGKLFVPKHGGQYYCSLQCSNNRRNRDRHKD